MARFLSAASRVAAALSVKNAAAPATNSRGYLAAASRSTAAAAEEKSVVARSRVSEDVLTDSAASSWVPDPVSGYYRPANHAGKVDPAELRAMLLSGNKLRH